MSAAVHALTPTPGLDQSGADFSLIVFGLPGPQGSKSFKGMTTGRRGQPVPRLVESSAKVKPWRDAVSLGARQAVAKHTSRIRKENPAYRWELLDGPLEAAVWFTLPRPQRPKHPDHPIVYPDLSKLLRSTEDALSGIVWADDARVVGYRALYKRYPGRGENALSQPGVLIRVWKVQP